MCFFIAGVQPKTQQIETAARRCPRCGLYQAHMQRTDHYLSLFFIPLFPVKRGTPYLFCRRCRQPVDDALDSRIEKERPRKCTRCGQAIEPHFSYCPHCGQQQ